MQSKRKSKSTAHRKPPKGGTASSKKHTFQTFTQKVAAIKIDPIRRVRRHIEDEEATAGTASFFHSSLEEWIDLNLSATFTDFVRKVKPWSESLPHVVHNQDKIMDALVESIDGGDDVGMEPLLNLLSQLARDLGVQFEKHFQRAVELLLRVATKRTAAEVIEFAFNSLAYLLKYLSRLLVPDLRPLFDLLSPLLGKTNHKPHLTRFAAEAFSFLLRKAREDALKLITHHISVDLVRFSNDESSSKQQRDMYLHGLSVLFTEACMGVDHHLHSRGSNILKALLLEAVDRELVESSESAHQVLRSLTTNVVVGLTHRMNQSTYEPLLEVVFEYVDELLSSSDERRLSIAAAVLHCCIGTRKGTRIENWGPVMQRTEKLLNKCAETGSEGVMWETSLLVAVAIQSADLPNVVGKFSTLINTIRTFKDGSLFLPFCEFFASMGGERFGQFLLAEFRRFTLEKWSLNEDQLCLLIPKFYEEGILKSNSGFEIFGPIEKGAENAFKNFKKSLKTKPSPPSQWDEYVEAVKCYEYLETINVLVIMGVRTSPKLEALLKEGLISVLVALEDDKLQLSKISLLTGRILSLLGENSPALDESVARKLVERFGDLGANDVFLVGFSKSIAHPSFENILNDDVVEDLFSKLEKNLSSPLHETRTTSLNMITALITRRLVPEPEAITLMKLIEDTPLSITTSRTICMHIRKLGVVASSTECDSRIAQFASWFCFGLLTIKFAALWDDTISTMKALSERQEELIASTAITWLEAKFNEQVVDSKAEKPEQITSVSEFECSNLSLLVKRADQAFEDCSNAGDIHADRFDNPHEQVVAPSLARTQSLKLFCEFPHIAEKRSRRIVPIFLDWYYVENLEEDEDDIASLKQTRADKIAILTLFSKFNNPKSLYKTEAVFSTLLNCLASGDAKVQGIALKAVYTWKLPGVRPYEENLNNLVDEDRFREEITNFIQVGADESKIQDNHREQLMPVLLRVLYGRSLARKNSSSGSRGMESRRTVVLAALTNFPKADLDMFLDIALGALSDVEIFDKSESPYSIREEFMKSDVLSLRKQLGFVNMMEDLFKQMGSTLLPFSGRLMDAIFYCVLLSSQNLGETKQSDTEQQEATAERSHRGIRQVGFRCLNALFTSCARFEWTPYMPAFFQGLINPRLDAFPTETAQSVSGLLQLFSTWASSPLTAQYLYEHNHNVVPKIVECLAVESVKDNVVTFILDFVHKLVDLADKKEDGNHHTFQEYLLEPHVDLFIVQISGILQKSPGKDILDNGISAIARLSPYISGKSETSHLIELSLFLLSQPTRRVNPKSKSDILKIVYNMLPHYLEDMQEEKFDKAYRTITSLFGFFHDQESRELLSKIMVIFVQKDETLAEVAGLCDDLNSYSKRAFGEPDFDRRLKAFSAINEGRFEHFTARQWVPLINNMLYFIRDQEELVVRTSSSYSLRRFVEAVGSNHDGPNEKAFLELLSSIVMPAALRGSKEQSELIRMEYVSVMSHMVQYCSFWSEVSDMKPLLVDGDEEANFFFNVLHIQQHRRIRALKRLAQTARKERLNRTNVTQFFMPLCEHFVFDQDEGAHNLATEAINTISVLAEQLEWNQFRAVFKRYIGYIKEKSDKEKIVIRILGAATDALYRAALGPTVPKAVNGSGTASGVNAVAIREDTEMNGMGGEEDEEDEDDEDGDENEISEDAEEDIKMNGVDDHEDDDVEMSDDTSGSISYLSTVLPPQPKLVEDITNGFLPSLIRYLHHKDEAMVSLRMPLSISIVKLLRVLPEEEMNLRLSGVLMDICHVLRSRDQGSRDTTRKTLAEISMLLGPKYFGFIIKELKGALLRGYQLHVLSYTVHSLLLSAVPQFETGVLDYCAPMVADVVMEDIFGVTGAEKEAEGYTNKMKEVKSSKSYDSMELMARITTAQYLQDLVKPIKGVLGEKLNLKIVKKVDELLRRMSLGIIRNESLKSQELLVFCWQVVQDTYKRIERNAEPKQEKKKTFAEQNRERFIVDLQIHKHKQVTLQMNTYDFKFIKFALDLLRSALQKYDFLMTPENLDGFMPIIGDAMLADEEEVQISAIRLLSAIIKVDLPAIKQGAGVYIAQCMTFIRSCPSTNAELAQASLKLLSTILREKKLKDVKIKDASLAYLLDRIAPDLEEPDRQGVTFNFVKAVLSRKIIVDGVYDVMEEVARIMVTNQARSVRDSCRGIYFQFVTEYPQGSIKLKKQLQFLTANLDYEHESGRKSVMEAMHLFLTKVGGDARVEIVQFFFVPLVMSLVNDESAECREMAGALLGKCLERADKERLQSFLGLMKSWLSQREKLTLTRVAVQLYGMYFETYKADARADVDFVSKEILSILEEGIDNQKESHQGSLDPEAEVGWELMYFSLQTWSKIVKDVIDDGASKKYADIWNAVQSCLRYHHAWIRLVSSRLVGLYFGGFKGEVLKDLPLRSEKGAEITKEQMIAIAKASFGQLRIPDLSEELGLQAVRNLVFLARCFYANGMKREDTEAGSDDDDENDSENDDDESNETEEASNGGAGAGAQGDLAIQWLITRAAATVRHEKPQQKNITGRKSGLQLLASITQIISAEDLVPVAPKIIMPLYNLVESESEHLKDLKPLSQEILQMLSNRMGTTSYTEAYATVRTQVSTRRRERKHKRSIQLVSDPEKAARRKMRKHERGKESKRAKSGVFREMRRAKYM